MRIRSIRPEFWSSEDIAALDWPTRLIFIGLWSYVDDNGVGRDNERLIKADLFPLEDDPHGALMQVTGALKTLNSRDLITRYEVDGRRFLHITTWERHQKINRPSEGRYPLPTCGNVVIHDTLTESSVSPPAKAPLGEGEKGRRGEGEKVVARKRATQRPDDWKPDDKHRELAEQLELVIDRELEQFTDYHDSKGSTFKDWDAAFRTWLRNAAKWGTSKRNPYSKQQETDDLFGAALERARANDRQELTP